MRCWNLLLKTSSLQLQSQLPEINIRRQYLNIIILRCLEDNFYILHDYQSPSFPVNQFIRQGLKIHSLNYPVSATCIDKGNLVINQRPYLSMLTKYLCAVILTMKGNVKQSPHTFNYKLYYWDETKLVENWSIWNNVIG